MARYVNDLGVLLLILAPCLQVWDCISPDGKMLVSLGFGLTAAAAFALLAFEGLL